MKLSEFTRIGDLLARQYRISIKEGSSWSANINKREVYFKKRDIYTLPEDHSLGLLLHEVAHIHYTSGVDYPAENQELLKTALNMLEDLVVEKIISNDYPNAGEILASTEQEVLDTLVRILPKLDESVQEKCLHYAAVRFRGRGYELNTSDYEIVGDEIAALMAKRQNELYGRKKTSDLLPLAKSIAEIILKRLGQPTAEQKSRMAMEADGQTNSDKYQESQKFRAQVIRQLGGRGFKAGEWPLNDPRIKFVDKITDQSTKIGKRLRNILRRNNAMEFGGRYRTGKILAKRLVRMRVLRDKRAFARRIIKSNQSYAFAIASDVSGSMFGGGSEFQNSDYALSSMHMVAEALKMAGVPRSMIVFGSKAKVVAPMSRRSVRWHDLAADKFVKKAGQNATDIAAAIDACVSQLREIKAERKIMIVLTDGASDEYDVEVAHKKAKKAGIECIGITLGGGSYSRLGKVFSDKRNIDISDTGNTAAIGDAFLKILKETITTSA